MYSLKSFSEAKILVIVFSANHCPTAQAYEERLISITNDYRAKGVELVMISSNDPLAVRPDELAWSDVGDSYEDMIFRYKDKNFNFPYLYDGDTQKTALAYGALATPHTFVFNAERKLKYVGRIDEVAKPGTTNGEDLRNAIDAVLSGKDPDPAVTKAFGCSTKWSCKIKKHAKKPQKSGPPVTLDTISISGIKELVKNDEEKLILINVWATWCGPCVTEFPDLVMLNSIYGRREFGVVTISTDPLEKQNRVHEFLKEHNAISKNYISSESNKYKIIEAIDPNWQGPLPYSMLVEPGGKVIYRHQGTIDLFEMKRLIIDHPMIGRYF
jgi:thiol-disulfide isomerase/thioredoxin